MKMYERYGSVKIIITGGEPSLYPEFLDLMATLTRYHRVSFDTNLFRKLSWVRGLTQQVVPDHLYMGISYHAEFSTDLEDFIRKVEAVRDAGIEYRVHLVCYRLF
jgi:MoaA/NifB/PqqE/SkfB family radical SAM enzyme